MSKVFSKAVKLLQDLILTFLSLSLASSPYPCDIQNPGSSCPHIMDILYLSYSHTFVCIVPSIC